jgi:hypothetical protein
MFCDPLLGVSLVLPAGWSAAPQGKYSPGSLDFVGHRHKESRLAIEPIGIAAAQLLAAVAAADALTQGLTVSVRRVGWIVGGVPSVIL